MMDYEGIVRASSRTHAPKSKAPGAMGVVDLARPNAPAAAQQRQQEGQQAPARQQQFSAATYPTPMAMR